MNPGGVIAAVAFVLYLYFVADYFGYRRGVAKERRRQDDAATVICPNCANLEAPARRLRDTHATVKAVTWYADIYPAEGEHPVDDANQVLRFAKDYVNTVDRRKNG